MRKLLCISNIMWLLAGCGGNMSTSSPQALAGPEDIVTAPVTGIYKPEPLLWEGKDQDAVLWSAFTYSLIGGSLSEALHTKASDMVEFCPNYPQLDHAQRVNLWAYFISGLAKHQSAFKAKRRVKREGKDRVTGLDHYAEGLMQFSYQDVAGFNLCGFDWEKDKSLPLDHPERTISNPVLQIDCAVRLIAAQLHRHGKLILEHNAFWAVLKPNSKYSRIRELKESIQELPFCAIAPL